MLQEASSRLNSLPPESVSQPASFGGMSLYNRMHNSTYHIYIIQIQGNTLNSMMNYNAMYVCMCVVGLNVGAMSNMVWGSNSTNKEVNLPLDPFIPF